MRITSNFEQGKIKVLDAARPDAIKLELTADNAAHFTSWFYFRVTGAAGKHLRMTFVNAVTTNQDARTKGQPETWENYNAFASYDLRNWFLVPTEMSAGGMIVSFTPEQDSIYFAEYPPYPMERGRRLVARSLQDRRVKLNVLGTTPDGHDLDVLTIGEPGPGKKVCWVTTRQHPNEIQGSWCVEGLVERLLLPEDPFARALLQKTVWHVVPNANPDGCQRGNTRSNALGANLNREWIDPKADTAPEVLMIKQKMEAWGIDWYLDVHAWAGTTPFALGPYRTPTITKKQEELWTRYEKALAKANPEFRVGNPYPGTAPGPGEAYVEMSWNDVTEHYQAFGLLYELIFKDNDFRPDPGVHWTPQKCKYFGHSTLEALHEIVDDLGR